MSINKLVGQWEESTKREQITVRISTKNKMRLDALKARWPERTAQSLIEGMIEYCLDEIEKEKL